MTTRDLVMRVSCKVRVRLGFDETPDDAIARTEVALDRAANFASANYSVYPTFEVDGDYEIEEEDE